MLCILSLNWTVSEYVLVPRTIWILNMIKVYEQWLYSIRWVASGEYLFVLRAGSKPLKNLKLQYISGSMQNGLNNSTFTHVMRSCFIHFILNQLEKFAKASCSDLYLSNVFILLTMYWQCLHFKKGICILFHTFNGNCSGTVQKYYVFKEIVTNITTGHI